MNNTNLHVPTPRRRGGRSTPGRLLALLLTLAMMIIALPVMAVAAPTDTALFTFNKQTGTITAYTGTGQANIVVPARIDGVVVRSIGASVFANNDEITSVELPLGVESISEKAFFRCSALQTINLPESIDSIGAMAFQECKALRAVKLPARLQTLQVAAFEACTSLKSIVIPGSVKKVADSLLYGCYNLEEVVLGEGITEIGSFAIANCIELKKLTLPEGVQKIDVCAFKGDILSAGSNVGSVILPSTVTTVAGDIFTARDQLEVYIKQMEGALMGEPWSAESATVQWVNEFATVSYKVNGADGAVADAKAYPVGSEAAVLSGDALSKPGYQFAGWIAEGSEATYAPGDRMALGGHEVLIAKWVRDDSIPRLTVTYDANDGSGATATDPAEYITGSNTKALGNTFDRVGWIFTGWNTERAGGGTSYGVGNWFTLTENVTLYAQWVQAKPTAFHVFYNANGGTGLLNDPTGYVNGNKATILLPGVIQRVNYDFLYWTTKADGTGTKVNPGETVTIDRQDVVLYAQWTTREETTYQLTYANGTDVVKSGIYSDNEVVTVKSDLFAGAGGTFHGWNTRADGTGSSYQPGDKLVMYRDTVLYAQWSAPSTFAPNLAPDPKYGQLRLGDTYSVTYDGMSFFQNKKASWYILQYSTENAWYDYGYFQNNSLFETIKVGGALLKDSAGEGVETIVGVFALPSKSGASADTSNMTLIREERYTPGEVRGPITITRADVEAAMVGNTDNEFPGYIAVKYAEADVEDALYKTSANYYGINADPSVVTYRFREANENSTYYPEDTYSRPHITSFVNGVEDPNGVLSGFNQSFNYFDTTKTTLELEGDAPVDFSPGTTLKLRLTLTNESPVYRNGFMRAFIQSNGLEYVSNSAVSDDSALRVVDQPATDESAAGYMPVGTTLFALIGNDNKEIVLAPGDSKSFVVTMRVKEGYNTSSGIFAQSVTIPRSQIQVAHMDDTLVVKESQLDAAVTFKVVNGTWSDQTTADKTVAVALTNGRGTLPANDVPTGMRANSGYEGGAWDIQPNTAANAIAGDVTYTYAFTKSIPGGGGGGGTTKYTLTFVTNDGSKVASEKHAANSTVQLTQNTSRDGYRFMGWYSDAQLTDKITSIKMTGDKTVYAKWQPVYNEVPEMLNGDNHYAYIVGSDDGLVYPGANITRAEVATILFRLLKDEVRKDNITDSNSFSDVNSGEWFNTAVSTMAKLGIVKGRGEGIFDPAANITRAEFAVMAARFDYTADSEANMFDDISGHWAEKEINRAASLGWVQGDGGGSFRPDDYITRAEVVTLVNRVLVRNPENADSLLPGMKAFADNMDVFAWYYMAIQEAANSHDFERKVSGTEQWTQMTQTPDWSTYEK